MNMRALLLSASALAFTCAGTASAQSAPGDAAAPAAAQTTGSDQDIVVTALRHNDRLSRTPGAASVLTGTDRDPGRIAAERRDSVV